MEKIYKKKKISEVVDSYGELIGGDDKPRSGVDLESQASNTTDYNAKVKAQPFRYDMLGRFGFTMLPFFEGDGNEDVNDNENELLSNIAKILHKNYLNTLEYYYRNPNKLKSDFRKQSKLDFDSMPEDKQKELFEITKEIIGIIHPHLEDTDDENKNEVLDPKKVDDTQKNTLAAGGKGLKNEEKVLEKKTKEELTKKNKDREVLGTETKKIAGLLNKVDEKLKNILEKVD